MGSEVEFEFLAVLQAWQKLQYLCETFAVWFYVFFKKKERSNKYKRNQTSVWDNTIHNRDKALASFFFAVVFSFIGKRIVTIVTITTKLGIIILVSV